MNPTVLVPLVGRRMTLTFRDGFVATVRLLEVACAAAALRVDVLQIVDYGPADPWTLDIRTSWTCPACDIVAFDLHFDLDLA